MSTSTLMTPTAPSAPAVPMVLVLAYVQPFRASAVVDALHGVPGVTGATFAEASGFGRGRHPDLAALETVTGTAPRTRVEVVIRADLEDAVVQAIREAARTTNRGDGKIYVLPVARAVRIATGEEGGTAV
ncbi:P-II family nitrogen regulator [Roseisolibacter agri]|uniref:Nitrogen regulatory protein P-II n=1 Tax=Roseisolibacter agri TaxID=2014610 RepID=A0AA37QJS0_9BACT|nr:P-II family nitrogen regulator [Roseisolibacter agri]GLC28188.1 nitrogen regulatory protein P-II [Roseisolibacter agri]